MSDYIQFSKEKHVAQIHLNRPEKLNAFTPEMYEEIGRLLDGVKLDEEIRVLTIQGNGRAFSSGFDISVQTKDRDVIEKRTFLHEVANANRWKIWNLEIPVVAKIHGYCLGGAFELVLPADFIYAAEDTLMGEPEILFGATPAFLALPWIVNVLKTKEILLLGHRIKATEAEKIGLVTKAVPKEELDQTVHEVVQQLVKLPQPAIRMLKKGINRAYEIQGMKEAIDGWVDSTLLVGYMKTPETEKFAQIVAQDGLSAALKWRDDYYQE